MLLPEVGALVASAALRTAERTSSERQQSMLRLIDRSKRRCGLATQAAEAQRMLTQLDLLG